MQKSRGIQLRPNPLRANTPCGYGQVLGETYSDDKSIKISKGINLENWTCDVRMWSGEIIKGVKLPGGFLEKTKKGISAHGTFNKISENQLVLVNFAFGSCQNPIISEAYPYYTKDIDFDNLKFFTKKNKFKKDDIVIFHNSGYSIWMSKLKILLYLDVNPLPVATIDLQTMLFSVNMKVSFGSTGVISVPNGELLLTDLINRSTFETQTKVAIELIKTALLSSPTVPLDGGTSYKAGISSVLSSLVSPTPVIPPPNLLNTSLKVSAL